MLSGLGIIDEEALNIFTDGSSFPQKKRASGVGVRLVWVNEQGNEETSDHAPPGWESATIDEVEIKAVTVGIVEAQMLFDDLTKFRKILIFSDSRYVVENFSKAMHIWPKRAWKAANGMPVANIELWKELRKEVSRVPLRVDIQWVKAHKSNLHNRAADKLAKKSAEVVLNKPFTVSGTAKKWSSQKTTRGCVVPKGQLIKVRVVSWEYIRKVKMYKYRYEVVDHADPHYNDVDFAYCETNLSRNHCYLVRLNSNAATPTFIEIIEELDSALYKPS